MSMTPIDFYNRQITTGEILEDPQQLATIQKLQELYVYLSKSPQRKRGLFRRAKRNSDHSGIYLWGEVGIGKTHLIDAFFYCLPFQEKLRIHFYQFMKKVHESLKALEGTPNPLKQVARQWSMQARVICFDELLVNDIADAMILAELLQALLKEGICLTFTSNRAPDELYENGLQRQRFVPFIETIKENLDVIHLSTEDDYRTLDSQSEEYYWYPITTKNQQNLAKTFSCFAGNSPVQMKPITILDREIRIKAQAGKNIWFEFDSICGIPRSSQDYLALCEMYDAIFVSNVPTIRENEHDLARTFIQLVDVLYDAGVKLLMCGAVPVEKIYPKGKFSFEFERTASRLKQMLSGSWEGAR
jgi:cell division protein ZapE